MDNHRLGFTSISTARIVNSKPQTSRKTAISYDASGTSSLSLRQKSKTNAITSSEVSPTQRPRCVRLPLDTTPQYGPPPQSTQLHHHSYAATNIPVTLPRPKARAKPANPSSVSPTPPISRSTHHPSPPARPSLTHSLSPTHRRTMFQRLQPHERIRSARVLLRPPAQKGFVPLPPSLLFLPFPSLPSPLSPSTPPLPRFTTSNRPRLNPYPHPSASKK